MFSRSSGKGQRTISGVFRNFNFSPEGEYEGALLDTDEGVIQINWHPDESLSGLRPGQALVVVVAEEPTGKHPKGDHPVVHLVSVVKAEHEREGGTVPIRGTVVRFNYARHGEPNGLVLDTGDFVHLKPHGMKRTALVVGQHLAAEGASRPSITGGQVIEAKIVNGISIECHKA
jgi:hypothetical protein